MNEQSHKDEMRAALRGDFERLRARRPEVSAPATGRDDSMHERDSAAAVPAAAPGPVERRREPVTRASWLDRVRGR